MTTKASNDCYVLILPSKIREITQVTEQTETQADGQADVRLSDSLFSHRSKKINII